MSTTGVACAERPRIVRPVVRVLYTRPVIPTMLPSLPARTLSQPTQYFWR